MSNPIPVLPAPAAPHVPGKIITLPPGVTVLDDPKDNRPHVALTPCGGDPAGILAYGSTQLTEAGSNTVYHTLKSQVTGVSRNGLRHTTYIYPAILARPESEHLKEVVGFTKELPRIRAAMVQALDLGRGTCRARNAPTGSCRGKLVCVKPEYTVSLGTPYVVIVTGHVYSVEQNYQAVVPVYDANEIHLDAFPDIVIAETGGWIRRIFGLNATRAAFVVPFMHSVWHRKHIAHGTGHVIEPNEMRDLEETIRNHFSLP